MKLLPWAILAAALATAACNACYPSAINQPSPTPEVVSTRFTALLIGELTVVNDCIRVNAADGETSYLLVWPPDFDFRVEGMSVRVIDKLKRQEATWHIGDIIRVGGGEISHPDDQLRRRWPAGCTGPYWVFGGWLEPTPSPR